MKKLFCLLLVLVSVLFAFSAFAADNGGDPLTLAEMTDWAARIKAMAMNAQPLNDPTEEAAFNEDGYCFIYEFGVLYMDKPEMTDEAVLNTFVIYSSEESEVLRGVHTDYLTSEVFASFYSENPDLVGTKDFAVLYLADAMPEDSGWGLVQRDGQRVQTIQYTVHEKLADGSYSNCGVIYTIEEGLVAAIRAYGLADSMTASAITEELDQIREVAQSNEYAQVKTSLNGSDLDVFGRDDLIFSGIDFLTSSPEDLEAAIGTALEDNWAEDDNGEFLRFMEFDCCTVTYVYDAKKENPVMDNLTVIYDALEGPRAVRLGDTFSSVLNRFRNGEGEYNDETGSELLYGDGATAPTGIAEYGLDSGAELRYTMEEDGRIICLTVTFDQMVVSDITLYTVH